MKTAFLPTAGLLFLVTLNLTAATLYVTRDSVNPTTPYSTWATAATNIQDALNAAIANDIVLVTNGAYSGGLSVAKPLTLLSVNGPLATTIDGGGTNRCISLNSPTAISGFTMTNGWTLYDGGAVWSTYNGAFLTNCIFSGNCASNGGGVYEGTLYNCTLTGNCASNGAGGAAFVSDLYNCTLTGNSAKYGGGALYSFLHNCIVYYNTAATGSNYAQIWGMTNCCTAPDPGMGEGNITSAPLFVDYAHGNLRLQSTSPCIDAGNNAYVSEATDLDGNPRVSIITVDMGAYEFQKPSAPIITLQPVSQTVYAGSNVGFQVGTVGSLPMSWQWRFNGTAIMDATNASLALASVTTNQAGGYSVVITNTLGAVTSQVAVLTVIDSKPLITVQPPSQTVSITSNATFTVGAVGSLPLSWQWFFNGNAIKDATNSSLSLISVTTDQVGIYSVIVSNALGTATSAGATLSIPVPGTKYVWQNSASPTPPYASWATAAHVIQDAVDVAVGGDAIIVTNGIYAAGGRPAGAGALTNRVVVEKPLTLRSVNGPEVTIIQGYQVPGVTNGDAAVRCVYITSNAVLSGFTLTNGATRQAAIVGDPAASDVNGGGVYSPDWDSALLTDCKLTGNSASVAGGASAFSSLCNCILTGNSAGSYGGGAYICLLTNCTVVGNSAPSGGGTYVGGLYNCIIYYNTADVAWSANWVGSKGEIITFCCTTPLPNFLEWQNIEAPPLFVDQANGDFHLQAASPCINAGTNAYACGSTDLDGHARIVSGTVDIGAFEFQSPVAPLITLQPLSQQVPLGGNVTFTVGARGSPPLFWRWQFNGTPISGATDSTLTLPAVTTDQAGMYSVIVSNAMGSVPSTGARLTVLIPGTRYVWQNSPNPTVPYTNWATAAHVIQDAVDVSVPGDTVLVTNGVYASGWRATYDSVATRVVVPAKLEVRSINGPGLTVIEGGIDVDGGASNAVRCLYLGTNAGLSGFTLTNGHSWSVNPGGGGALCEPSAVLSNCVLSGNSTVGGGGGVCGGTLNDCTLTANSAMWGGGAYQAILNRCVLSGNSATNQSGGGAYGGTLNNCILNGNFALYGGGVYADPNWASATLNNCVLTGNSASQGGGVYVSGGGLFSQPTGAGATLNNCTLTGNSADEGGGAYGGAFNNCIVYYNTAGNGPNYFGSTFAYSCTTPLPLGVGNFETEPLLASATHLSAASPCIFGGSAAFATGVDIDGETWGSPPCVGADQFVPTQDTGPLTIGIHAGYTNVSTGFAVPFEAAIDGKLSASVWDFGDGVVVSNRPFASHTWNAPGAYWVRLTVYRDIYPGGVSSVVLLQVAPREVYYVSGGNATPAPPYTSWPTAATNIQDAIDAGSQMGRLILVADGIYNAGSREAYGHGTNRVVVAEGLEVRSVNGPALTVIAGGGAGDPNFGWNLRCAYVGTNAILSGFTLTNGVSVVGGGGAWCERTAVVTNCTLTGNLARGGAGNGAGGYGGVFDNCIFATNSASSGGGAAYASTLNDCVLIGNSADTGGGVSSCTVNRSTLKSNWGNGAGGGAFGSALNNCTLKGNGASNYGGGGAWGGILNNCLIDGNSAVYLTATGGAASYAKLNNCTIFGSTLFQGRAAVNVCAVYNSILYFNDGPNFDDASTVNYCCTTPMPASGIGNITNAPLFVDPANGDLHLQASSPCINAGSNLFAPGVTDLSGSPRIVGGTVDIGAYEYQSAVGSDFYAWLQSYGLPTDGSADYVDTDGDGLNNYQEWLSGTNPTNSLSTLRMLSAVRTSTNVTVTWQSVAGITYSLERSTNFALPHPLANTNFVVVATNLLGQAGSTAFTDTYTAAPGPVFYRVGVQGP